MVALIGEDPLPVCKAGQGADCCRYLTRSAYGYECLKLRPLGAVLDARVAAGAMVARGDNCAGIVPVPVNKTSVKA